MKRGKRRTVKCWLVVDEICKKMHRQHKHDEAEECTPHFLILCHRIGLLANK